VVRIALKMVILLALGGLLISGCKKHDFNFGKKVIGDYVFSIHETAWDVTGYHFDTLYSTHGEIQAGDVNNRIIVSITPSWSLPLELYEDGTLKLLQYGGNTSFYGECESTSTIKIYGSYGGMGGGGDYSVVGYKMNE